MAKQQFLDSDGLTELVKYIPQLVAGDNITLTPDVTKSNKITISSTKTDSLVYANTSDIDALFTT